MKTLWMLVVCCFASFSAYAEEGVTIQQLGLGAENQALLIENHDLPVLHMQLRFSGAGSVSDPEGREGLAMMMASLLSEGAGDMEALAFQQALEDKAIDLSFAAGQEDVVVSLTTLTEHKEEAFRLLALALQSPRFDESAVARVKAQMAAGLRRALEQPDYVAGRALAEKVFPNHVYNRPSIGTPESVGALTGADAKVFVRRVLARSNLSISMVGDVTAKEATALLKPLWNALPQQANVAEVKDIALPQEGSLTRVERNIPQTVVVFASQGIPRKDKDFYAAYVLNYIIGGGTLTSRLGDEIREQRGLAYYAYSGLQEKDHAHLFTGSFGTSTDKAEEALNVMRDVLTRIRAGEITPKEVEDAKGYITGSYPLTLASNEGMLGMLVMMQKYGLPLSYFHERNTYFNAITHADVVRVAKRLLNPEALTIVAVGKSTEEKKDAVPAGN